jgi:putative ABC transport system permease protein
MLTMLGIIIGVAQIITLIGLGNGIKKDVQSEVTQLGTNLLVVLSGKMQSSQGGFNPASSVGTSTLTEQDLTELAKLPDVLAVTPMALVAGVPTVDTLTAPGSIIMAVNSSYFQHVSTAKIVAGQFFTDADSLAKKRVIVLDKTAQEALFPNVSAQDVIGKQVKVGKTEFAVVGSAATPATTSAFGNNPTSAAIYIPFTTAKDINPTTQIFRIGVKATDTAEVKTVKKEIQDKLNQLHGAEDTTVFTQDDLLKVIDSILSLITKAIVGLSAISLLVGGIGIMNIMLVAVTERTREIGLRKAVGATFWHILVQFLTESVVLSLFGGAIGVAIAEAASIIVKRQANLTILVDWNAILIATLFSLGVGVVFGLAPAIRAAKKDPIDALRYE